MGQAQEGIGSIGRVANDYLLKKERQDAIDYQRGRDAQTDARLKVQDDRATQLWNEQQAEKQKIEYANQVKAVENQTLAASENQGYNQALKTWVAGGMQTPSPVIQDYPMILNQGQNVDISVKQPSVSGSSGSSIFRGVRVPAGTNVSSPILTQQPNTGPTVFDPTKPVVAPNAQNSTDYTNIIPKTIGSLLGGEFRPLDSVLAANKKLGEGIVNAGKSVVNPVVDAISQAVAQQANTTYSNGTYNQSVPNTTGDIKAPLISKPTNKPVTSTTTTPVTANSIAGAQTPALLSQQNTSNKTVPITTTRAVSGTSTSMPNMVQINPATLDKIFGSIDPNAQKRRDSREMLESMYYSLGLSPKQVKEYTDGAAESVYGDANDPLKIALANSKANAYEKNASTINTANLEGWKVNQDNATKLAMKEESGGKAARDPIAEAQAKFLIENGLPIDTPPAQVKIWMNESFSERNQKRAADLKRSKADADAAQLKYEQAIKAGKHFWQ
jgi:hypothetical protein